MNQEKEKMSGEKTGAGRYLTNRISGFAQWEL